MISDQAAHCLVEVAANVIRSCPQAFHEVLDHLPAAIYSTDPAGTVTYFNRACVSLAGRKPQVGIDKWCVTWKIYTTEGEYLPHDACPMAVSIREERPVRDVEAVAERPDGRRVHFRPHPTPVYDDEGRFAGAVNLLLDVTHRHRPGYQASARTLGHCPDQQESDLETLARMAARVAGKNPDHQVTMKLGDVVAFQDAMWRYPDFTARAEAAYRVLEAAQYPDGIRELG
jgi:PAS domain S-box-containing protein